MMVFGALLSMLCDKIGVKASHCLFWFLFGWFLFTFPYTVYIQVSLLNEWQTRTGILVVAAGLYLLFTSLFACDIQKK